MNGRMGPILFGPHVMEKTLNEGSGPTLVWATCGLGPIIFGPYMGTRPVLSVLKNGEVLVDRAFKSCFYNQPRIG